MVSVLKRWSRRLRGLAGHVHEVRTPEGVLVSRRYAADGHLEEETFPASPSEPQRQVTRRFDEHERLRERVTTEGSRVVAHTRYDPDGSVSEERLFDDRGRLEERRVFSYAGDTVRVTAFDAEGNELSRTEDPRHSM